MCVPSVVAKFTGNFNSAVKKDNTLGQPDPVQNFGKKGQDGAVQNCCPNVDDPKVTFLDSVRSGILVCPFLPKTTTFLDRIRSGLSVCMYGHTYNTKSMDQPGKIGNPARGQLNREN